jgi:hypothetical protein
MLAAFPYSAAFVVFMDEPRAETPRAAKAKRILH